MVNHLCDAGMVVTVLLMERRRIQKSFRKRLDSIYAGRTVAGTFWIGDAFIEIAAVPIMLTARFIARAITAMDRELNIPVLKSHHISGNYVCCKTGFLGP